MFVLRGLQPIRLVRAGSFNLQIDNHFGCKAMILLPWLPFVTKQKGRTMFAARCQLWLLCPLCWENESEYTCEFGWIWQKSAAFCWPHAEVLDSIVVVRHTRTTRDNEWSMVRTFWPTLNAKGTFVNWRRLQCCVWPNKNKSKPFVPDCEKAAFRVCCRFAHRITEFSKRNVVRWKSQRVASWDFRTNWTQA